MLLRNLLKVGQPSSADLIWVQRPNNKNQFYLTMDFAVAQMVKNLPAVQENRVRSLGWEDPLEKGMQSTPVFLLGECHGQRSLAGCSPQDHKELATIERLTLLTMDRSAYCLIRACGFCLWSPLIPSVAADSVPCLYLKLSHPSLSLPFLELLTWAQVHLRHVWSRLEEVWRGGFIGMGVNGKVEQTGEGVGPEVDGPGTTGWSTWIRSWVPDSLGGGSGKSVHWSFLSTCW